ncbi:MAG: TPMT family class I SAM-dependent methyltransferase [Cyclobacteriaceae bacterium]|nr:TPMT family class I SAM-dependent methyltransferase [Cyclobacteriaceae bacterium]
MDDFLTEKFWTEKYKTNNTGWDIGAVSSPLKAYIDQLTDKNKQILLPGAGNAYEAEYLFRTHFKNVSVLDLSPEPLRELKTRIPEFPEKNLHQTDFFEFHGQFDLILEQTFFCAIHPSRRQEYANKMHKLLRPGGRLVGVLFDDKLNEDHPPFGGNKEEYLGYFDERFEKCCFERCYNSIPERAGRELFINLRTKK